MKPINNWNEVKASEDFQRLPAGGYIVKITNVTNNEEKQYLHVEYDIAEGEFKGYWDDNAKRFGWWGGDFYRSYKDSALGMFKGFTNAVEGSNDGYQWNWEEQSLVGKLIGVVVGEEEYIKNDGSIGTRLKVRSIKTVSDIKDKRFRMPDIKKLPEENNNVVAEGFTASDDSESMPF